MSAVTSAPGYNTDTFSSEWRAAMGNLATTYAVQAATLFAAWQAGRLATREWQHLFCLSLLDGIAAGSGIGDGLATRVLHLTQHRDVLPVGEASATCPPSWPGSTRPSKPSQPSWTPPRTPHPASNAWQPLSPSLPPRGPRSASTPRTKSAATPAALDPAAASSAPG